MSAKPDGTGDACFGDAGGFGDDGGFGAADWGADDSNMVQEAGGAFGFADLDAALEEASQATAKAAAAGKGHAHAHDSQKPHETVAAVAATPSCMPPPTSHMLPEFYLHAELEPEGEHVVSVQTCARTIIVRHSLVGPAMQAGRACLVGMQFALKLQARRTLFVVNSVIKSLPAGGAKAMSKAELAHVQELLRQYEQGEEQGSTGGTASAAGTSGASQPADAGGEKAMSEESWAPEEYEEGEVRGVQGSYLKFSERLQRRPDQCVR